MMALHEITECTGDARTHPTHIRKATPTVPTFADASQRDGHIQILRVDDKGNPILMEDDLYTYIPCECGRLVGCPKPLPHFPVLHTKTRPMCGHCYGINMKREREQGITPCPQTESSVPRGAQSQQNTNNTT